MEVNRVDEVLFVAEAAGRVLYPLDPGVDGAFRANRDDQKEAGLKSTATISATVLAKEGRN